MTQYEQPVVAGRSKILPIGNVRDHYIALPSDTQELWTADVDAQFHCAVSGAVWIQ